jgi:HEAT repeat protein
MTSRKQAGTKGEGDRQKAEEQALEALVAVASSAERDVQIAAIRLALENKHCRVVARAARLASERSLREHVPDLLRAYPRFLTDAVKRDPKCLAKQAITRALVELDCSDVEFFLAGIRYRQPEPVWGGTADSAVDVRCSCAMGLAATGYFRAIQELTSLLSDSEWRARAGAARAISCGNPREAEAVLRFKVHVGDEEPQVIGECFAGLLGVAPEECLPFVASYLAEGPDNTRDFAALALGESRHPQAFEHLRSAWDGTLDKDLRVVLIRAAALHRSEAAFDWLLGIIEHGSGAHADVAVEALSVYERNTRLTERVHEALARREGGAGLGET